MSFSTETVGLRYPFLNVSMMRLYPAHDFFSRNSVDISKPAQEKVAFNIWS